MSFFRVKSLLDLGDKMTPYLKNLDSLIKNYLICTIGKSTDNNNSILSHRFFICEEELCPDSWLQSCLRITVEWIGCR